MALGRHEDSGLVPKRMGCNVSEGLVLVLVVDDRLVLVLVLAVVVGIGVRFIDVENVVGLGGGGLLLTPTVLSLFTSSSTDLIGFINPSIIKGLMLALFSGDNVNTPF